MRFGRCKRCKLGEDAENEAGKFVLCRALPERPVMVGEQLAWVVPPKTRESWCGLFSLSLRKLFRGHGAT